MCFKSIFSMTVSFVFILSLLIRETEFELLFNCIAFCSFCSILQQALHPRHGLTWTDGRCIYLAPINIIDDEVGNSAPMKLGEFE